MSMRRYLAQVGDNYWQLLIRARGWGISQSVVMTRPANKTGRITRFGTLLATMDIEREAPGEGRQRIWRSIRSTRFWRGMKTMRVKTFAGDAQTGCRVTFEKFDFFVIRLGIERDGCEHVDSNCTSWSYMA